MSAARRPAALVLIERLGERRRVLAARLNRVQSDRRRENDPLDPDFAEQAVQRENDEVLDALDEAERSELREITAALDRFEAGCYGICDDCGNDIDPLRLDVNPAAQHCVRCAATRERNA